MAAPQKNTIDLLPQESWEKTSFGKVLKWILNVGRYIVIITELIVILAFFSRFKLDRDLTNLNEQIEKKQAVIQSHQDFEKEFRFLQTRLSNISSLHQEQASTTEIIKQVSSLIPIEVTLDKITVDQNQVKLSALALSESGLAAFLGNLKSSPYFKNLDLSNISSGTEKGLGIEFQIQADFMPALEKQET